MVKNYAAKNGGTLFLRIGGHFMSELWVLTIGAILFCLTT
jgi:hypothetical protein